MTTIDFFEANKLHGVFSNFFVLPEKLLYRGLLFDSSEHLYQWFKYTYTGANTATEQYANQVRNARTPNQSRVLAQQKIGGGYAWHTALNPIITKALADGACVDPNWEAVKLTRMRTALRVKFAQPTMRAKLIATGTATLREASPYDSFWGIGRDGKGQNWLGRLLMELREEVMLDVPPQPTIASTDTANAPRTTKRPLESSSPVATLKKKKIDAEESGGREHDESDSSCCCDDCMGI